MQARSAAPPACPPALLEEKCQQACEGPLGCGGTRVAGRLHSGPCGALGYPATQAVTLVQHATHPGCAWVRLVTDRHRRVPAALQLLCNSSNDTGGARNVPRVRLVTRTACHMARARSPAAAPLRGGSRGSGASASLLAPRNARRMSSPAPPLFSGWNCVACTCPSAPAALVGRRAGGPTRLCCSIHDP